MLSERLGEFSIFSGIFCDIWYNGKGYELHEVLIFLVDRIDVNVFSLGRFLASLTFWILYSA